ncbi:hypothetical protein BFW01_g5536 [Lasiodiplodia theobromae]|uniref:uncharacterized protein n=1 Tax=Lasiodiplodia theobromae TaxID=45133 RepID=UPI0015C3AD51|nr:uncharacterized protein LTHEOB_819 [Lasiodiplodia theobromae]KAF4540877.1 hypothetical protein LTHEOB_819 [Lasiodiplodia theobromae]KAF9634641.1 hypothetical protein BFW01_g5536 [Lasiodiplodia theobromae]
MARPRKSAIAAEQRNPPSSSQDGPRGTRRKRRTSTDSVVDDDRSRRESTQQSDLPSIREESNVASDPEQQRPRKKRVKRVSVSDQDQLAQELQEAVDHESRNTPAEPQSIPTGPQPQPQHTHRRVRFSDPGPPIASATPTHRSTTGGPITPTVRSSKPNRRVSLPATFGIASPDGGLVQFTPLRAVLEDRKRRRLRRWGLSEEMNSIDEHKREDARARRELQRLRQELRDKDKRVNDLIYELEVQRQFAIEVQDADRDKENAKVRALEDQLDSLRKEVAEQKERHERELATIDEDPNEDVDMDMGMGMDGPASDDEENDGFMLIEPEDINLQKELSQLPDDQSEDADGIAEGTQTDGASDVPDPSHEVQIQQFENAIAELSKEASEAKAALQILSIELQTLGFTEPEANAYDVLTSLRSAFQHVRNEVEAICPGDPATELENGSLIYSLVEKLRGLRAEVNEKVDEARQQSEMNNLLNNQNKGLVDKMAEYENRRQTLEGQWHELDIVSEKKTKEIIELEEELEAYKAAVEERDNEIVDQDNKMDEMEVELTEREQAQERLKEEINSSREEVASLQELISRVEEESRNALERLKEEHAAAIAELEQKLATEQLYREQAEKDIEEKTSFITELEAKVEAAETDLEQLRENLIELQDLRDAERTQRETAEEELDDKNATISDLEEKVEKAESDLEELREELESLRNLSDAEREQLEAAIAEVEEKDDKIAELEQKIHDAGSHANELRQKLFELQVQKQAVIEELEDTAAKREEQYNQDIAAEIARREAAEQIYADRNAEMAELQSKLHGIEENLEVMTIEKDDLITELEKRVDKLEEDLIQLRVEYNDLADQKAEEIQALHDDIAILNSDINEKAELIEKLREEAAENEEAHKREIEQKEARIAELTEEMDAARTDIQSLEATRSSLEHRVEDAAVQMLDLQNMHGNEIDSLRDKIENNEAEIDRLRRALELREDKYTSDINKKNEQLESLQLLADNRLTNITALENQVEDLKRKFREQTLSSRKTMATLAQSFLHAAEDARGLSDRHAENSDAALREVEGMVPEGMEERANALKQGGPARRGRRQFDSGIGVADDDEDMLEETLA